MGGRGRRIPEFEVNLDYRVSSRTVRATQRNLVGDGGGGGEEGQVSNKLGKKKN